MRVTLPEGEVSLVTSDISPIGAFFVGVRRLEPGALIDVLVRPAGLKIAPVRLHSEVVRVVQTGGSLPPGFAVRWIWALSEAGAEPIFQVLYKVLHVPGVREEFLQPGRRVRFDFPAVGARFEFRNVTAPSSAAELPSASLRGSEFREEVVSSGTRVHQARTLRPWPRPGEPSGSSGAAIPKPVTSVPASSLAAPTTRGANVGHAAKASVEFGTDMEFAAAEAQDKTPPNGVDFDIIGGTVRAGDGVAATKAQPDSSGAQVRSGGWSTWRRTSDYDESRRSSDISVSDDLRPVGRRPSQVRADQLGQPGNDAAQRSRRSGAEPGVFLDESSIARQPSAVFDAVPKSNRTSVAPQREEIGPAPRPRSDASQSVPRPSAAVGGASNSLRTQSGRFQGAPPAENSRRGSDTGISPFLERSQIFGRAGQLTSNFGIDSRSNQGSQQAPVIFDLPVTYEYDGRLVPGRLISAASHAVEISTRDTMPSLDERMVVNLPVEVKGCWRTVSIHGKMLKNLALREDGAQAMIVAIERLQEGSHAGAYARMLRDVQAEAGP